MNHDQAFYAEKTRLKMYIPMKNIGTAQGQVSNKQLCTPPLISREYYCMFTSNY